MDAGSEKGRYNVARCYYNGISVQKDAAKAAQVMGKAVWDMGRHSSYESQLVDRAKNDARGHDDRANDDDRDRDDRVNNDDRANNNARDRDSRTREEDHRHKSDMPRDKHNGEARNRSDSNTSRSSTQTQTEKYTEARNRPDSNYGRSSTQNQNVMASSRDDYTLSQRQTRLAGEPYTDGNRDQKISRAHDFRAHDKPGAHIHTSESRAVNGNSKYMPLPADKRAGQSHTIGVFPGTDRTSTDRGSQYGDEAGLYRIQNGVRSGLGPGKSNYIGVFPGTDRIYTDRGSQYHNDEAGLESLDRTQNGVGSSLGQRSVGVDWDMSHSVYGGTRGGTMYRQRES
jgi:hypothetical protein